MTREGPDSAAASPTAWLRMDWEAFRVALPQSDIVRVDLPDDLRPAASDEDCAAWLKGPDGDIVAVFRLDESMRPTRYSGRVGYIVVCVGSVEPFGLWCDSVRRIAPDQAPRPVPLPAIFSRRRPPLNGMDRDVDGAPLLTARAEQLGRWLFAQSRQRRQAP